MEKCYDRYIIDNYQYTPMKVDEKIYAGIPNLKPMFKAYFPSCNIVIQLLHNWLFSMKVLKSGVAIFLCTQCAC